ISGWKLKTINTNKCAILALYQEDNKIFNDHHYTKQLYTLARRQELKKVKSIPVVISPVFVLVRAGCIDVTKSKVNAEGIFVVHIVALKEKVDGKSTTHTRMNPHPDTVLLLRFLGDSSKPIKPAIGEDELDNQAYGAPL
ncbi:hypothetical protein EC957_010316, partial [Mortierella hygrophila]